MSDKKFTPREAALQVLKKAEELYKSSSLAKGDWAKIHSKLKREGYSEESADKIDGAIKAKMKKAETGHEKGVHHNTSMPGSSVAGAHVNRANKLRGDNRNLDEHDSRISNNVKGVMADAHINEAKGLHTKKLNDLKAMPKPNLGKSEENPDASADADLGEKVEQDVHEHEEKNSDPAHAEPQMKGHIKLAKFMGRMEHKKGQKSKEIDKAEEDASKMSGKTGMVRGTTESNQNQTGVNQMGNNGRSGGMSEAGNLVRNAAHSMPKRAAEAKQAAKGIHQQTLEQIHQMTKPKLPG